MFRPHCVIFRKLVVPAKLHKYLNAVLVRHFKLLYLCNLTVTDYKLPEDDAIASKHAGGSVIKSTTINC